MSVAFAPRINLIIDACKLLDRRGAAEIIRQDLAEGPKDGQLWREVGQLAEQLGEQGLALEAARRYAATAPVSTDRIMYYALALSRFGRLEEALKVLEALPRDGKDNPAVWHFRGVTATQMGDFDTAIQMLEKGIAISPAPIQWLALSVAKKFKKGDPDIARMEAVLPKVGRAPAEIKTQLLYALGKAYDDVGNTKWRLRHILLERRPCGMLVGCQH